MCGRISSGPRRTAGPARAVARMAAILLRDHWAGYVTAANVPDGDWIGDLVSVLGSQERCHLGSVLSSRSIRWGPHVLHEFARFGQLIDTAANTCVWLSGRSLIRLSNTPANCRHSVHSCHLRSRWQRVGVHLANVDRYGTFTTKRLSQETVTCDRFKLSHTHCDTVHHPTTPHRRGTSNHPYRPAQAGRQAAMTRRCSPGAPYRPTHTRYGSGSAKRIANEKNTV
jgi:hypothetical protein